MIIELIIKLKSEKIALDVSQRFDSAWNKKLYEFEDLTFK